VDQSFAKGFISPPTARLVMPQSTLSKSFLFRRIVELLTMNKVLIASLVCLATLAPAAIAQDKEAEATAHKRKGVALQSRGQLALAIIEYQKAIDLNPSDASSHNNLGLALKDMDLLDDSENQLRAAIELKPTSANYHYNLGVVMMRKSNLAGAETEFRKAMQLNDKDAEVHFRLAQVLMLQGKPDEAEHAIRCALDLKPSEPIYSHLLGDILLRQIKTELALTAYKRAAYILGTKREHDFILDNKIEYVSNLLANSKTSTNTERASD
jgi:Flp pilus assembly protein TadD